MPNFSHGTAGIAYFLATLYRETHQREFLAAATEGGRYLQSIAVTDSGRALIFELQTPGFWNNVSQCCGSAGVAEFFLNLYRATKRTEYLSFAKRVTADLIARGNAEKDGLKWIQAEHRVKPDLLAAQTGYMEGAAGIGIWLLHLDAFEQGKSGTIVLPDSPF